MPGTLSHNRPFGTRPNDRAMTEFLNGHEHLFVAIARRYARFPGVQWNRDADDLVSLVTAEAAEMFAAGMVGAERWQSTLFVRSHTVIREWSDSGASDGFGGGTSARRRSRSRAKMTQQLTQKLQREPSHSEVMEAHNAAVTVSRVNARKQGALLSESDFHPIRSIPTDDLTVSTESMALVGSQMMSDMVLDSIRVARAVLGRVTEKYPSLEQFAGRWLAWLIAGTVPTVAEIAVEFDTSTTTVNRWMGRVIECAHEVCVVNAGELLVLGDRPNTDALAHRC